MCLRDSSQYLMYYASQILNQKHHYSPPHHHIIFCLVITVVYIYVRLMCLKYISFFSYTTFTFSACVVTKNTFYQNAYASFHHVFLTSQWFINGVYITELKYDCVFLHEIKKHRTYQNHVSRRSQ